MADSAFGLWLDIQTTQNPPPHSWRGIPRYVAGHTAALLSRNAAVRRVALNPLLPFPARLPAEVINSGLLTWSARSEFRRAAAEGPMAHYIMSPFEFLPISESVLPPFSPDLDVPLVVTLYDLIPLLRAGPYLPDRASASRYYARLEVVKSADLVLSISDHTRQDAIDVLGISPGKVRTIGAGVSPYFRPTQPGEDPGALLRSRLPTIAGPFFLSVLGAEERKNTERLIQAYGLLHEGIKSQIQLVVVCQLNDIYRGAWNQTARDAGIRDDRLVLTDLVPDPVLRALYQTSELFVFPSLYEGFGLPAAEAAACGCPVVTSNSSSLPEVLAYPPATFDPTDPAEIAAIMERAIIDSQFAHELRKVAKDRAPLHSWDAVAERTMAALEALPAPPPSPGSAHSRPLRLRVAFAGSFDSMRSRFGAYNAGLVDHLEHKVDLDVFYAGEPRGLFAAPERRFRLFPAKALGRSINPAGYDAIIFSLDEQSERWGLTEIASAYPGIAWVHEVDPSRAGDGLLRSIVRNARGILVDSRLAEQAVRLTSRLHPEPARIEVMPIAPTGAGCELSPGGGGPLQVAGISPDSVDTGLVLLDTIAMLLTHRSCRLSICGPVTDDVAESLRAEIVGRGLASDVELCRPSRDNRCSCLSRASVAIEIQTSQTIRSSPLLLDALASGVPVVTNLAASRDFPAGTVHALSPEVEAPALFEALRELLNDPAVAARLRQAGASFTADLSLSSLSDAVLAVVADPSLERMPRRHISEGESRSADPDVPAEWL